MMVSDTYAWRSVIECKSLSISSLEHRTQRVRRADFLHFLQCESEILARVSVESASIFIRRSYANYPLRLGWIQEALRDETEVLDSYMVVDGLEKCGV